MFGGGNTLGIARNSRIGLPRRGAPCLPWSHSTPRPGPTVGVGAVDQGAGRVEQPELISPVVQPAAIDQVGRKIRDRRIVDALRRRTQTTTRLSYSSFWTRLPLDDPTAAECARTPTTKGDCMGGKKRPASQPPPTAPQIEVDIPSCFSTSLSVERNTARQLLRPRGRGTLSPTVTPPLLRRVTGEIVPLVASPSKLKPGDLALRVGREGLRNPAMVFQQPDRLPWVGDLDPMPPDRVAASWPGTFSFALGDYVLQVSKGM